MNFPVFLNNKHEIEGDVLCYAELWGPQREFDFIELTKQTISGANMKNLTVKTSVILALFLGVGMTHLYALDKVYTGFFNNNAVGGYDAVSYFTGEQPVKGKKRYSTTYKEAKWSFSSQNNLDLFKSNPGKYAPRYGGYCAWAVSQGYTAEGDPLQWSIHKGKLYLNYDESINKKWLADKEQFIAAAETKWPEMIK